ncbi:MAG: GNAT family N-acetyltransferase [Actinobacteria bacterium]|nr:GNAT family N-acetyltransferase [Actinomycetota bacterium]
MSLPEIPAYWTADVVLTDGGTVHLRPRRPGDRDALVDLYARMSEQSRYLRFAGPTTVTRAGDLESRATVDLDRHFAVVAELGDRVVGVAAYFRQDDGRAEVSFAVADDQQGRGLATIMLEYLAAAALEQGIHRFVAWVLTGNRKMLQVFRNAGFEIHKSSDGGTVEIVLDLVPTPQSIAARQAREHAAEATSIRRLLRPRSIAVVGASRTPGSIGHGVFRNLIDGEFTGPVYPVNPHAGSVAGVRAYPSVGAIPDTVDLAIVATPADTVLGVVEECAAAGVGGLVVISAGFAEVAGGRERERAVVAQARRNGMRVIGPNCMGILNTADDVRMNATFAPYRPRPGRIAFASQSGGLGIALLGQGAARGLGISTFVSMGNKADVSGNDLVQYWEEDPDTDVILLYLESFGNPRKFARLARRISRTKPIVAVKSGRSPAGARGAGSHTAAPAAPDVAVDALFAQAGVVRVDTLEELFDTALLLAHQPLPRGRRVAIVTNGGGPGILAADACVARGLEVPELPAATQARLAEFTSPDASVRNPIDLVAAARGSVFERALRVVLDDDTVDAVIAIYVPPLVTETDEIAAAILAATTGDTGSGSTKPVVACFLDPDGRPELERPDERIPTFAFPEAAAAALVRAARLAEWRARPEGVVPDVAGLDLPGARAVVDATFAGRPDGGWLDPDAAHRLLECFGIPVVRTRRVTDAETAMAAADALGYPVVLKVDAPSIVHKTDVGGVRLGLDSPTAVRDAFTEMRTALGDAMVGAVVQPLVPAGIETIVGVTRDPLFGSLVVFGMGGFETELVRDTALRIVPVTDRDAHDLVRSLRSSPLFFGYRNTPPVAVAALEDLLVRVGLLAEYVPEVAELDGNPVIVSPTGVLVVDAKVHLAPHTAGAPDGLRRLRSPDR